MPPMSVKIVACAAIGATPLKSRHTVSPVFATWIIIVPEPAIVLMNGSTTGIANAVATAASIALPPRARTAAPTSAPAGCSAVTSPRAAIGVVLVRLSLERIMVSPSKRASVPLEILGDRGEVLSAEEESPAEVVHPRFGNVALQVLPVFPPELFHLARVRRHGFGGAEEDQHLLLGHARDDLLVEPERGHVQGVGSVLVLSEVLRDLQLELVFPMTPLVEARLAVVRDVLLHHPELARRGPVAGALLERG